MTLRVRRVVTGHDGDGRAVVTIDEISSKVTSRRPNVATTVVWSTEGFPVDNADDLDGADREVGTSETNGTVFRIAEYAPGASPRTHRTESIDYAVVISGEIDMHLDDGVVHLKAGDVVVQRGTIHSWENRGSVPCVVAYVLIGAKPVEAGGTPLTAVG